MKTLTYINLNGDELVLKNYAPYVLQKFSESQSVKTNSNKGVDQDGSTYLSNTLDDRDISLEIAVLASTDVEINNCKKHINRVLNPKLGEGYLVYSDGLIERKIKCIATKLPFFSPINSTNYNCLISLTANNPYWGDLIETRKDIARWVGSLEFPLELISGGIEFGVRLTELISNIFNQGDTECGIRVVLKALASVTNPSITKIATQEFMKINKVLSAGETLTITTNFRAKEVNSEIGGIVSNAFNSIDLASTFIQLDVGDNLFGYSADSGIDNLEVSIYYSPQYLGV